MSMMPARTKYRKQQRGRNRGFAKGGDTLAFGEYGIQVLERGQLTANQIEAARVAINRSLNRRGKVWIRIFPHKPITKKPAETRQGKGKGPIEYYAASVKPGVVLFELAGVSTNAAREAMRLADGKLPLRCRFISKDVITA
jgi:large subunit ribosomal protein L16